MQAAAAREFEALADALRDAGVNVHAFDDTPQPHTPDSIFPNNWVSFHADGTVVLYPMLAENRRHGAPLGPAGDARARAGLSHRARRSTSRITKAAASSSKAPAASCSIARIASLTRACRRAPISMCSVISPSSSITTSSRSRRPMPNGAPIYHTNVLMCDRRALRCGLPGLHPRGRARRCAATPCAHRARARRAQHGAARSIRRQHARAAHARAALASSRCRGPRWTRCQRSSAQRIERLGGPIVAAAIPTIETLGGGSVRCMLAEIHLPKKLKVAAVSPASCLSR